VRFGLLLAGLLLSGHALAQQLAPAQKPIALTLQVEQVQLIVQTLQAIGCPNVGQLLICQRALETWAEIKRQAAEQQK
jgi:hypothetical protein